MAAPTRPRNKRQSPSIWKKLNILYKEFSLYNFLNDPSYLWIIAPSLIFLEIFVLLFVIEKIPYTEIDWKAYMQEVEGVINGTLDYKELQGDTGPLVYPAGFVYTYLFFYAVTQRGTNIYLAQYMFAVLYLLTLALVFRLYWKTKVIPPYAFIFMCCTSYRVHSIYVLRLFNDPVAIFFFFIAMNLFVSNYWMMGCIAYSLAVSVKMNILLYAPGLFYLLMMKFGLQETFLHVSICGVVQVLVGLPFLLANPISYVTRSFNMGRIFLYQWTVNWRLLPENVFLSRYFHVSLLVLHVCVLLIFYYKWNRKFSFPSYVWPSILNRPLFVDDLLLVMFTSNFIGVMFCRSLHYQFYIWYFFTLPYLLWTIPSSPMLKLCILGVLELSWNTYPSTILSSSSMLICHIFILIGLLRNYNNDTFGKQLKSR